MTEPVYGRFDQDEFKRRGNDRHLVLHGQPYRIAELVPQMDGSARYQAWPVEEDARAREEPETVPPPAPDIEWQPPAPEDTMTVQPVEEQVWTETPKLADYARKNGWTGHGPISKVIREKYTAEFGVEGGRP